MQGAVKDRPYESVGAGGFADMLDLHRYGERSSAFDKIISATHEHFWDPLNSRHLDFTTPFDLEREMILPEHMVVSMAAPHVKAGLKTETARVRFANAYALRVFSSILHGEQAALSLSASLCHLLKDPGAQEYAANQAREEARHVTAFTRYIKVRWGEPVECGPALKALLVELVETDEVYKKIVGMQMLVEGLAMGAFAAIFRETRDPLARRLTQLVMTDEAFHHKFGKVWADRTVPQLSPSEHAAVEVWAARCFETLLGNLLSPTQHRGLYAEFGLDADTAIAEMAAMRTASRGQPIMQNPDNMFRVLIKTLHGAGIVTDRTRPLYAAYVDLQALAGEAGELPGDTIALEGMAYLREISACGAQP